MIVFANTITHRLRYILDFIGTEIAGQPFSAIDNVEEYINYDGPKINYSHEQLTREEFWLQPNSLLFEQGIKAQAIECFETDDHKFFFKSKGDFPFDIFAASFYLLSRYEEYLPHQKDMYGRYAHENSLAFKENFLDKPIVNRWLLYFQGQLKTKFPSLIFKESRFRFLPTYDIDEAWSYKHKPWWRSAGSAVKDLLKGNLEKFSLRRKVLNNQVQDPYDSYEWMDNLHRPYTFKPRFFFLVTDKRGKYDRNIMPSETALQVLIRQYAEKSTIGVHPSWQSGEDPSRIEKEIQTIENITKINITSSRQHYIRFTLPQTFRLLLAAGIKEDFSMGYGSINGFRASVASPFFWYDLEKEQTSYLLLYPFCFMEANSFFEQKSTPEQALEDMRHYYREVKAVNGMLITIWHNTFLGTEEKFKGWRDVYSRFVKEIS